MDWHTVVQGLDSNRETLHVNLVTQKLWKVQKLEPNGSSVLPKMNNDFTFMAPNTIYPFLVTRKCYNNDGTIYAGWQLVEMAH